MQVLTNDVARKQHFGFALQSVDDEPILIQTSVIGAHVRPAMH